MAYEKQNWLPYDDNKTEEENIEAGAVVTAERMNHIEDGVEAQATKIEFDAHLDDKENPHEVTAHQVGALTAEETSANVINQVIGKENAKINITLDYQNKIAGSVVENPHKAAAGFSSVIPTPAQVTGEVSQNAYNALSALDGDVTSPYTATNKDMTYFLVQWNVLEALERELGSKFFIDRGATTTKEKVEIARTILTVINPAFWGYGKSPSGNKLNFQIWINNSSWAGTRSHNASTVTKMEYNSTGASTNNYISDDGYLYASAYAEPSDGTVASTVVGDCAQLNLEIEISANDHIESTIATYYGKNLGNVDNYETATQVDAESGTATDKFMTPLRTKQHVSSRIASQTEAESGTATEKLMTPLRTKQHVDKRIATKAEAEAGTSETAIMSPLRTKEIVDTNQPFGVSISGGLMEGVNRVDGTTLTIGTIISYDNTHSKTNDLFNISSDQKTMTILRDCTLFFTGMFVSQTSSGSYYSVMRQFINGVNDLRLCGIAGTVNWRNDCGFSATRSFLQGDKITFVLGTNYTNASAEAFGISQLHIQEVLPV